MKARRIIVMGLALLAVGCSSATTTANPSTTAPGATGPAVPTAGVSASSVAHQYQTAAIGADAAYLRWRASVTGATKVSQVTGPAATYAAAMTKFDNAMVSLGATGKEATDIAALVRADQVVIGDLNSASSQTDSGLSKWAAQLSADGAKAIQAGQVVRADLGLPPV